MSMTSLNSFAIKVLCAMGARGLKIIIIVTAEILHYNKTFGALAIECSRTRSVLH